MSIARENIDACITDLLHINDVDKNKLIDLGAGDASKTFYVYHEARESVCRYMLSVIASRIGKPGNTVLRHSAMVEAQEQIIGQSVNAFEWKDGNGVREPAALKRFIENAYKELSLKGNNPLFLSIGALHWQLHVKNSEVKNVRSPLLLFPIRLVRTDSGNTPVFIEFIQDDIYLNPCLIAKLRAVWGEQILQGFPHPNGVNVNPDVPVELEKLGDGDAYFTNLEAYIRAQSRNDIEADTAFSFDREAVAILQYNHEELCMYYDIQRNKEKIYNHPLIASIFSKNEGFLPSPSGNVPAQCILPRDSAQTRMINRVINGESLIIKGPPGTGKTLTITNLIASLLAANKKVLLSSQKPAAMFEVYAKLPEELRKFVMLLDSETETQAAKLNPSDVRMEFSSLLNKAKGFKGTTAPFDDLALGKRDVGAAQDSVRTYTELMFGKRDVMGFSYYEALDRLCEVDAEPIAFESADKICALTRPLYLSLKNTVEEASAYYEKLANGHAILKSPWHPLVGTLSAVDIEGAIVAYQEILQVAQQVLSTALPLLSGCDAGALRVGVAQLLMETPVNTQQIQAVLNPENRACLDALGEAWRAYRKHVRADRTFLHIEDAQAAQRLDGKLRTAHIDGDLPVDDFLAMCAHWDVVEQAADPTRLQMLLDFYKNVLSLQNSRAELQSQCDAIYRCDLTEEQAAQLSELYTVLAPYIGTPATAPKMLDFKAKKLYAATKDLGYGTEISFADAVKVAAARADMQRLDTEITEQKARISSMFKIRFSEDQMHVLLTLIRRCLEKNRPIRHFVESVGACKEVFFAAVKAVALHGGETLGDVRDAVHELVLVQDLEQALLRFVHRSGLAADTLPGGTVAAAGLLYALGDVAQSGVLGRTPEEILHATALLYDNGRTPSAAIRQLRELLAEFAKTYFESFYTYADGAYSFSDLRILCDEVPDKGLLAASNAYLGLIYNKENVLALDRFFRPFELGERATGAYSFAELFEHSVLHLAVKEKLAQMPVSDRYGVGERMERELDGWRRGSERRDRAMLSLIEQQCISRVDPTDEDFAFLGSERAGNETLRKMFKKHASAILKLKKCFILSPSSVSVFFGREELSNFDIVIVDEASQLEPTAILPVLVRAKQVVLVGDEWQMPPIRHFVSRTDKHVTDDEGNNELLDPDTSVLSLALSNCAFPAEQLLCHYRSRTEALITFSQRRFYRFMRTFPTPIPKCEGLGFRDVYTPDGYCEDAVNEKEAQMAVQLLREHFERCFDEESGKLSESIGVVAFGQKQTDHIRALVRKDKELETRIARAIASFGDVAEKLIFFKTIETVQGQETDHLLLSLTYGRNKNGALVQAFGELNRGAESGNKLGQCIFNVAVTRAKSSITVLHSVRAEEITNPNVSYIGEYLRVVEQFDRDGRAQFVGDGVESAHGFLRSVCNEILAFGIDPSRIVLNFGVTEGSVRIPIAILSEDQSRAILGIFCERDISGEYDYFDYSVRFFDSLRERGWNLHKLYIRDWVENKEAESKRLRELIASHVHH